MRRSDRLFHPLSVLVFAALAIVSYVALMRWRFPAGDLSNHFAYTLPILVPFVAFLFGRAQRIRELSLLELSIDVAVIAISMLRGLGYVPLVSGHVLFLTYAMARPGSRLTQITAALVMLQVVYLKFWVWHDAVSPALGIALGLLAAFALGSLGHKAQESVPPA